MRKRKGAMLQLMASEDEKLPGASKTPEDHALQHGGEPVSGKPEVLGKKLVCPLDSGILSYTRKQILKAQANRYNGVCWDFIGYRNYRSCHCPLCMEALPAYTKRNPGIPAEEIAASFYEDNLIHLYNNLYDLVKTIAPEMKVMCHLHPVFLPNPFFGQNVKIDICGITTSWFFDPHWEIEKVTDYTSQTVNNEYAHPLAFGMPMIGFYNTGKDKKTPERLAAELGAVISNGAKAVMMCELGNLLKDPAIVETVQQKLKPAKNTKNKESTNQ